MNERIQELLKKINDLSQQSVVSLLEKDLLLQYTRALYEQISALEVSREQTEIQDESTASSFATLADAQEAITEAGPEQEQASDAQAVAEQEPDREYRDQESFKETLTATNAVSDQVHETVIPELEQPVIEVQKPSSDSAPESVPAQQASDSANTVNGDDEENLTQDDLTFTSNEQPFQEPDTFELEPELKAERPFLSGRLTDFKLWNRDIRSYIGINDKYNFISELFGNNTEAYEEILNEINRCGSLQDTISFLNNSGVTTLYRWKEDGFSEQIFYNVLSQFFSAR